MKLTIVTPSFNQAEFIERTIRSVLEQSRPAFEHIIMDGGSTDDTRAVVSRFGEVTFVSEPDRGQSHALNKAIRMAKGDVIGWLNSDDVYRPGAFAAVLAMFEADPELGMVYGDFDYIDGNDNPLRTIRCPEWDFRRLVRRPYSYIGQMSVFLRRTVIEDVGPINENLQFTMDHEYWIRVGNRYPVRHVPQVLAAVRHHEDTKSLGQRAAARRESHALFRSTFPGRPLTRELLYGYWTVRRLLAERRTVRALMSG